jgi:hypothetical protein
MRDDGFGARLCALLDAAWLAERFGGRLGLVWPDQGVSREHNAIAPAGEVFSATFLAAHLLDRAALRRIRRAPLREVQSEFAAALGPESGLDGFIINGLPLAAQAPALRSIAPVEADRRAAFRAIRFAPELEAARVLAEQLPLAPGTLAMHLRAGDIVYGEYRASGFFHDKVVAYPVAMELLRQEAEAGTPVLLFGQDRALAEHARDRWGALLAEDLCAGKGFGPTAQALFEIALMARCARILAGSSAFCVAAAKIAGVRRINPRAALPRAQARAVIPRALGGPAEDAPASALQRAMAAWHAVIAGGYDIQQPEGRAMAEEAIRLDPANPYYRAMAALALFQAGQAAAGDAAMLEALAGPQACPALVRHFAAWAARSPVLGSAASTALLEGFARAGWPGAALVLAVVARSARRAEAVAEFAGLYDRHRHPGMPPSVEALLAG